jgi:hypothetical protein
MAFSPYEFRLKKRHRYLVLNFDEVIIFKNLKSITLSKTTYGVFLT